MVNTPEVPGFERAGGALASYLRAVAAEADARNYRCDKSKIARHSLRGKLAVTEGQLRYEHTHLSDKLKTRARAPGQPAACGQNRGASPAACRAGRYRALGSDSEYCMNPGRAARGLLVGPVLRGLPHRVFVVQSVSPSR